MQVPVNVDTIKVSTSEIIGHLEFLLSRKLKDCIDTVAKMVDFELTAFYIDPHIRQWGDPYDDFCFSNKLSTDNEAHLESTLRSVLKPIFITWPPSDKHELEWTLTDHNLSIRRKEIRTNIILPEQILETLYCTRAVA